jgi:hypothetical protein
MIRLEQEAPTSGEASFSERCFVRWREHVTKSEQWLKQALESLEEELE